MDMTPYLEGLRRDLRAATDASAPEVAAAAERLAAAIEPAARLALMEAISHATAEITSAMASGSVEVRLDGRDLDFVVDAGLPAAPAPPPAPTAPEPPEPEDDSVTRITLRLPESVKTRAEELAAQAGTSLNTWLVTAVRQATLTGHGSGDDGTRVTFDVNLPFGGGRSRGRRQSGWV
ncbi:toxin-antitoxin system HicB family antitoxin [Nocardioides bruguierae]|uniref:Toxin-antitoxin system HicB family antitoxin n=1 Tax=Nocardioides bruguierae TaxID=2945102 RepID=A0A9X2D7P5_9ACTN|nr:toxin-antitoxin system HicB family antitoxin [Nocardioides bruguierae]MCM0620342.1 toxin-antitoxin system HicB family antitoxin [Nocardioides bruguierae]